MLEHYYAVIMAGGGGTRLWPLSVKERPKQMLRLGGERSLFQMAIDRLHGLFPPERIFVVTVAAQARSLQDQAPEIPVENYLLEPIPRGTASVVGLAAVVLKEKDPQAVMAVLTADHYIQNVDKFCDLLQAAYAVAQDGYLVTMGITPTYAATGYGYIQRDVLIGRYDQYEAYKVRKFKEKPNKELAEELVRHGDHYWNSGMFVWRTDLVLDEIKAYMPELYSVLEEIGQSWSGSRRGEVLQKTWPEIKVETIDYGIMEKSGRVVVLPGAELGWNDVGSWDSLFDVLPIDKNGNIIVNANYLGIDTNSSLIFAEDSKRLIVAIGMEDMIIVDTGKALLICPRKDSQKVRQVVDLLKQMGKDQYL